MNWIVLSSPPLLPLVLLIASPYYLSAHALACSLTATNSLFYLIFYILPSLLIPVKLVKVQLKCQYLFLSSCRLHFCEKLAVELVFCKPVFLDTSLLLFFNFFPAAEMELNFKKEIERDHFPIKLENKNPDTSLPPEVASPNLGSFGMQIRGNGHFLTLPPVGPLWSWRQSGRPEVEAIDHLGVELHQKTYMRPLAQHTEKRKHVDRRGGKQFQNLKLAWNWRPITSSLPVRGIFL